MAIPRARKTLLAGLTAAIVACLGATALAAPQTVPAAPRAAGDMPLAVEDFNYPGADKLLQERQITLKRGDGHIILTDITDKNECWADPANILVESFLGNFCFRTNATTGYLTMELPKTFNLWTGDQPIQATLTAEGEETVVQAPANELTTVGIAGDTGKQSALVEIRLKG
ncbi:hypothetical protein [Streptomyces sp. FIT100]|uniref:hypothetical protein n=1 Tax=Streptomyces sp. FIT100 TaxID=2837956 RepID=UPI0021C74BC6|nr:hypothetical protein [Streptomyces sp. FIT100]UUN25525.1 hypothetical protein KK483_03155 [Streptomyces sp. FIT100]